MTKKQIEELSELIAMYVIPEMGYDNPMVSKALRLSRQIMLEGDFDDNPKRRLTGEKEGIKLLLREYFTPEN